MPPRDKILEKGISDIAGIFTDPIIVYPGGWGDSLPDWLRQAITLERLTGTAMSLKGQEPTGTDAEACAYLYTAGLTAPLDSDWADIYLYIATLTYEKHKKTEMPSDIAVRKLNDYQEGELKRLKRWLYERRIRERQEQDRIERRQQKEADEVKAHSIEALPLFSWRGK